MFCMTLQWMREPSCIQLRGATLGLMITSKKFRSETLIRPSKATSRSLAGTRLETPRSAADSGRLVVVSSRVVDREGAQCDRLAMILRGVLRLHGGLWFGGSGKTADASTLATGHDPRDGFDYAALDLIPDEHEALYNGFHVHALHALLRSRLLDMAFDRDELAAWFRVNARLAAALKSQLRPDDRIWVNDLHLLPVASELRAMGVRNRIGLFLHEAVPACNILASLPRHDDVFCGLTACDLIGVQTVRDLHALRDYLLAFHAAMLDDAGGLRVQGRTLRLATLPSGIDVKRVTDLAERADARAAFGRFRDKLGSQKLLIGIDRPDPANGLCQRLHAIDHLLQHSPQLTGTLSMLQIAPPVRDGMSGCVDLVSEFSRHVSDINGRHGAPDWSPVRYVKRRIRQPALAGYLRIADVGLMTPLRDGMTLAAKDYVACQEPSNPGVLVLSHFAGAAEQLTDAVRVNPLDVGDMAAGIRTAMRMPLDERRARWEALMSVLRRQDLQRWSNDFLHALAPFAHACGHDVEISRSQRVTGIAVLRSVILVLIWHTSRFGR